VVQEGEREGQKAVLLESLQLHFLDKGAVGRYARRRQNDASCFFFIETHLLQLPSDTTPIIGGDFNASIGIRSNPDDACIIGPYGLPHSNSAGEKLIDMARNCSLQASATYFKHCSYKTFYDLRNDRAPRQLDLIFVHQCHGPHVTDAGVFQPRNNIVSDHHATHLKLHLT
jgi:endonuclease/exonuclease/phosphatase family metal-dependent hydrolase